MILTRRNNILKNNIQTQIMSLFGAKKKKVASGNK